MDNIFQDNTKYIFLSLSLNAHYFLYLKTGLDFLNYQTNKLMIIIACLAECITQETFLLDLLEILEILKCSLQNLWKIVKKCFPVTSSSDCVLFYKSSNG